MRVCKYLEYFEEMEDWRARDNTSKYIQRISKMAEYRRQIMNFS